MQILKYFIFSLLIFLSFGRVKAQCINTFPYMEDFETGPGGWISSGINNDWALGNPAKPLINTAGSGLNCWISGGLTSSFYLGAEKSWVESPCFDFTLLTSPYIRFLIFWDTERVFDGGNLQYSTDAGSTWSNLGIYNDPGDCTGSNWFNTDDVRYLSSMGNPNTNGWSGNMQTSSSPCRGTGGSGKWVEAHHCMQFLAGQPSVKFRFTFGSGNSCNAYDGIAFDSIFIGNTPAQVSDFNITCTDGKTIAVTAITEGCPDGFEWDFGEPGSTSNSGNNQSETHTYSGFGNFIVSLRTGFLCSPDVQVQHDINILEVKVTDYPVTCKDGNDGAAAIDIQGTLHPTIEWSTIPIQTSDSIYGLFVGNYSVTVSDVNTCSLTTPFNIIYGSNAFPRADIGPDQRICPGSEVVLNPGNFKTYDWNDGSFLSELIVTSPGLYWVNVADSAGCTATDSVLIKEGCGDNVWVPTAFTPDNNGKNEVFTAKGIAISKYLLKVFNRWGQLVFSSENPDVGWDGTYSGKPALMGIYGYTIRYKLYDGKSYTKDGTVMLIR